MVSWHFAGVNVMRERESLPTTFDGMEFPIPGQISRKSCSLFPHHPPIGKCGYNFHECFPSEICLGGPDSTCREGHVQGMGVGVLICKYICTVRAVVSGGNYHFVCIHINVRPHPR